MSDYTPKEPGLYWARSRKDAVWYDLVVLVRGAHPFLRVEKVLMMGSTGFDPVLSLWGPEIDRPEVVQVDA